LLVILPFDLRSFQRVHSLLLAFVLFKFLHLCR
jgi:hypothetical protein